MAQNEVNIVSAKRKKKNWERASEFEAEAVDELVAWRRGSKYEAKLARLDKVRASLWQGGEII